MTTNQKWILAIAIIVIVLLLLYFNWSKVKSIFGKGTPEPAADGTDCTTSGGKKGIMKKGFCQEIPATTPAVIPTSTTVAAIQVKKPMGAPVYMINGNSMMQSNANYIPYGKVLTYSQVVVSGATTYYLTDMGYLSNNDVALVQVRNYY